MLFELSTLKARLNISGTSDDAALTGIAAMVHMVFDRWCNRVFERADAAEYIFTGSRQDISLPRYPVEIVISIACRSHSRDPWRAQTGVRWRLDSDSGVICLDAPVGSDVEQTRILYTGGYVLPGTTAESYQYALPQDIQEAALAQAMHLYESRHNALPAAVGSAPAKTVRDTELLPHVELALQPHRRILL